MKKHVDIYNIKQLEAITSILTKDEGYFHRKVCRWFSEKYSTPLPEVETMEWSYLLTHYYEAALEDMTYNQVFDMAQAQYIDEFMQEDERIRQKLDEALVAEQEELLAKKEKKKQQDSSAPSGSVKKTEPTVQSYNMDFEDEDLDDDDDEDGVKL